MSQDRVHTSWPCSKLTSVHSTSTLLTVGCFEVYYALTPWFWLLDWLWCHWNCHYRWSISWNVLFQSTNSTKMKIHVPKYSAAKENVPQNLERRQIGKLCNQAADVTARLLSFSFRIWKLITLETTEWRKVVVVSVNGNPTL